MIDHKFRRNYEPFKKKGFVCTKPSRTHQEFKDECDINNILKKYNKTGLLPDMIKENPQYGDFSHAETYHEALNIVIHAQTQFAGLPSKVRDRFQNDPEAFLNFVNDPQNQDELVNMGLAMRREGAVEAPVKEATRKVPSKKGAQPELPLGEE